MAAAKFINLFAVLTLALFAISFAPTPANALSGRPSLLSRNSAHEAIAKRKRDTPQRCRPRPSSSIASNTSTSSPHTSTTHTSSTTQQTPAAKAAAPSPASGGSGGTGLSTTHNGPGKVGLAWPNGPQNLNNFLTENVKALYTWSPSCPSSSQLDGVPCFPMLWGGNQVSEFEADVKGGGGVILGFNEPNQQGQSNLSPQQACDMWLQYIQPKAAQGYKLLTPAMSSNPNGGPWMEEFFGCCKGCTFDGLAIHWYDMTAEKLQAYLNQWHQTYPDLDVYLTEYAVQNFNGGAQATMDEIWAFHQEMGPWFNSQDWIALHCPFGFMTDMQGVNPLNQLMDDSGNPTPLGSMIINNSY